MRCKQHPTDLSSSVGVCASCLRERLLILIDEQTRVDEALAMAKQLAHSCSAGDRRKPSDTQPPPPVFPRSVSPYVSRRKSEHQYLHRFYSTPQVGPAYGYGAAEKKKQSKFSLFAKIFRSRSEKIDSDRSVCAYSDPMVFISPHRDSFKKSASSSYWLSFLPLRRKKQSAGEEAPAPAPAPAPARGCRRPCRISNRGMSPERGVEVEDCFDSGYSSESSSHGRRKTPVHPAAARRKRTVQSRSTSSMAFCLSPLVRASPSRQWSQKGILTLTPEIGATGEVRIPAKPKLSTAASFSGNRSRKLVDFGRVNPNR